MLEPRPRLSIQVFASARGGNVAMIFSLALVPLLIFVGAALDFSRHRSAEFAVTAALDAAVLAAARSPGALSDTELTEIASDVFYADLGMFGINIDTFTVVRIGQEFTATTSGFIDTTVLGLAGVPKLPVDQTATARLSERKFEIVLALDTTGSMEGQKLTDLKTAAQQLVDRLDAAFSDTSNLKIGLVPFDAFVNVGPANAGAAWVDSGAASPAHASNLLPGISRLDLYAHLGMAWNGCVEARPAPHDVTDSAPSAGLPSTLYVPLFHPDEPDSTFSYPNTYVVDASAGSPLAVTGDVAKYGIDPANVAAPWTPVALTPTYPYYMNYFAPVGPGFTCAARPLTPLTTNRTLIKNEINALVAAGNTNTTEGLMWAWRVVSSGAPFTQGASDSDATVTKIIILLSDGNNFINARADDLGSDFSAYGYVANNRLPGAAAGQTQAEIETALDARTALACENIKAEGIDLYTIRLDLAGDARSEALLSACASGPRHYLDVPDSTQLDAAFRRIASEIIQLHLAK